MKTINVKSSIAGIRTILHAPLVRALLLLAVATCLFFGTAYSAENHTVENSTIVPVVNANVSHENNHSPEQSHTPASDRGPLSPALNLVAKANAR